MRDLVRGRITGRLDIDKLLEDAGLPGPAAGKVRNVVKRTRLWRLEKVDVAQELIAHFLDGQEAGTPMDDLLGSFGDERQTAKLIRRAKKRQRPYAWHAFAWARLGFAVIIGVYGLAALYLLTGSPDIKTNYVAVLNREAAVVATDDAAWPIYREALLELNLSEVREWDTPIPYYSALSDEEREKLGKELAESTDMLMPTQRSEYEPPYRASQWARLERSLSPDRPGWAATVTFLEERQATLELIRRAAAKPGLGLSVGFISDYSEQDLKVFDLEFDPGRYAEEKSKTFRDPDRALIGVLLPHLSPMRRMAMLLAADTARAAEDGDGVAAYDDVVAIFGIADQADEQPLLINGLVALATRQIGYRAVQEILTSQRDLWNESQLRDLAHSLVSDQIDHEAWYAGERLWFYDYLQRTYTDDGHGGGRITKQGIQNFESYGGSGDPYGTGAQAALVVAGLPAASVLVAPRSEMRRMYDDLMDQAIREGYQPLWEYDSVNSIESRIEEMANNQLTRLRYLPIMIFMPALSAVMKAVHNEAGLREGVLIGIALELYKREHGDWPEALSALSPKYLPKVPVDRLTGQPLRYVVRDGGPMVYSEGVDGDDDGGRAPTQPDGDIMNSQASPKQFFGTTRTEPEHDGDWVLWPAPREQ
jgi:hypothetical protein